MYLIDRFSQLLRCDVALHFISTRDINDLTFDTRSDVTYMPSRILLTAVHVDPCP